MNPIKEKLKKLKIKKGFGKIKLRKIKWGYISLLAILFLLLLCFFQLRQMLISAQTFWQASLTNQTESIEKTWPKFKRNWKIFLPHFCQNLPTLIGLGERQIINYTILLQNDKELRATGGFMGSFAKLTFEKGGLKDFRIEDIYNPDGKIQAHIEPPAPIQRAFQQGTWRLPDSNWYADFPKSVETINWFFNKAGINPADIFLAVNFTVLQDIFSQLEPIKLTDYQTTITADNLYLVTQSAAETNFFPGSTQKKDFLNQLGKNLLWQIKDLNWVKKIKIARIILKHLKQKNVQIYSQSETVQNWLKQNNWTGSLKSPQLNQDYLLIVDTNLGANKANCCTQRKVKQIIKNDNDKDFWEEKLEIEYLNQSTSQNPQPPENWGGDYKNYLRLYLPQQAKINEVKIDDQILAPDQLYLEPETKWQLQSLGFFVNVPHQQSKKVEISYTLPKQEGQKRYQLFLQKQSGINYLHQWQYENQNKIKEKEIWVEKDQVIKF